jgi:toxin ParE1/3/4
MARYFWTEGAARDLNEIYDYVAARDIAAADRLIDEFDRKADLYAGNPALGEERPELAPGLRAFRVGKYVVLYRAVGTALRSRGSSMRQGTCRDFSKEIRSRLGLGISCRVRRR